MSAEYPVGTVARVRVGEWEVRAGRGRGYWVLLAHPSCFVVSDDFRNDAGDPLLTVLAVELTAPVAEPKAFGARVCGDYNGEQRDFVRGPDSWQFPWISDGAHTVEWSDIANPVVPEDDPEADR